MILTLLIAGAIVLGAVGAFVLLPTEVIDND